MQQSTRLGCVTNVLFGDLQVPEAAQKQLVGLMTTGEYRQLPAPPKRRSTDAATSGLESPQTQTQQSRARIIVTTQQAVQLPEACKIQQIKVSFPAAIAQMITGPVCKRAVPAQKLLQLLLHAVKRRAAPGLLLLMSGHA